MIISLKKWLLSATWRVIVTETFTLTCPNQKVFEGINLTCCIAKNMSRYSKNTLGHVTKLTKLKKTFNHSMQSTLNVEVLVKFFQQQESRQVTVLSVDLGVF